MRTAVEEEVALAWLAKQGAASRDSEVGKAAAPQSASPPSEGERAVQPSRQEEAPPAAPKAAAEEEEEAPAWGAELISMAEMCNEGTEYACSALSSEEAAKLAWLAKQAVASPGSKVAAAIGPKAAADSPMQSPLPFPPPASPTVPSSPLAQPMGQATSPPGAGADFAGFGFGVAVVMLAAIRTRLAYADLPNGLRGLGIAFTIAGMMSLGFSAFAQMVTP